MKLNLTLFVLFFSFAVFSQKIKIKKGTVFVDGEETMYIKPDGTLTNEVSYFFMGSEEEFLFTTYLDYSDPSEISSANPKGLVRYIEMNFIGLNKKFEISTRGRKNVVKFLLDNHVIVEGKINEKAVDKLVMKYGMRFSEQQKNGGVQIIINN